MKKIYFASDFHLGVNAPNDSSRERELRICRWLEEIKDDAEQIYLVGDVFDFWFEYKTVVPKGFIRFFGQLAALRDAGVSIDFFIGNHDMWMFRYLEKELGIPIHRTPIMRTHHGKKFFIGHGDGLGPGDYKYKMLKKIFANPLCQWAFGSLHPSWGMGVAEAWSRHSRKKKIHQAAEEQFLGKDKEWLISFCEDYPQEQEVDFFVFGHRHLAIDYALSNGKSRYLNLGEWIRLNSYAVFDGEKTQILFFENEKGKLANK